MPTEDWLEEEVKRNGMEAMKSYHHPEGTNFRSNHETFDVEAVQLVQSPEELYAAPVIEPKVTGKEAREQQAVLAQVVNTFAALEATAPSKSYEDMTDGEKFGRDAITLPQHYARFAIEPIRFAVENNLNFLQANIVKYILRFDAKNGIEDLDKAMRYLTMLKRFAQKDPDWWRP